MRYIYTSLIVIFLSTLSFSQQLSLNSMYSFNRFLINPGVTGNQDYIPVRLTVRQQWVGIDGAPSTQTVSAYKKITGKNMGIGGYVFMDRFGPEKKIGFQVSYAYILDMGFGENTKLGLGIAARGVQYTLDYSILKSSDAYDVLLQTDKESCFVPDADFGAYLYSPKYFVGISIAQLIAMKLSINENSVEKNTLARHYNLMGGYKYQIDDNFEIEPSTLIKMTGSSPMNMDINMRVIYKKDYWAGLSYRTSNTLSIMVGAQYKKFVFGYAYDYSMSDIRRYQGGSHEIILGYNINRKVGGGSSMM